MQPRNNEKTIAMFERSLYIFIIGILMVACGQESGDGSLESGVRLLEEAETALANDSIRQGESLLRKAIQLSEASEDWHTNYIAYQRLAEALSQSNPEEALRLMKKALNIDISAYEKGHYTVNVENSRESFTGQFDAQTTGIKAITNNKKEIRTDIYNLQGQRISSLQKGLNIVNGQKIYVK